MLIRYTDTFNIRIVYVDLFDILFVNKENKIYSIVSLKDNNGGSYYYYDYDYDYYDRDYDDKDADNDNGRKKKKKSKSKNDGGGGGGEGDADNDKEKGSSSAKKKRRKRVVATFQPVIEYDVKNDVARYKFCNVSRRVFKEFLFLNEDNYDTVNVQLARPLISVEELLNILLVKGIIRV